jgi:hypothetical protein
MQLKVRGILFKNIRKEKLIKCLKKLKDGILPLNCTLLTNYFAKYISTLTTAFFTCFLNCGMKNIN